MLQCLVFEFLSVFCSKHQFDLKNLKIFNQLIEREKRNAKSWCSCTFIVLVDIKISVIHYVISTYILPKEDRRVSIRNASAVSLADRDASDRLANTFCTNMIVH